MEDESNEFEARSQSVADGKVVRIGQLSRGAKPKRAGGRAAETERGGVGGLAGEGGVSMAKVEVLSTAAMESDATRGAGRKAAGCCSIGDRDGNLYPRAGGGGRSSGKGSTTSSLLRAESCESARAKWC